MMNWNLKPNLYLTITKGFQKIKLVRSVKNLKGCKMQMKLRLIIEIEKSKKLSNYKSKSPEKMIKTKMMKKTKTKMIKGFLLMILNKKEEKEEIRRKSREFIVMMMMIQMKIMSKEE